MPNWVSDGSVRKYHRALAQLSKDNVIRKAAMQPEVPVTEEMIKELYTKWGGLVVGDIASIMGNDEPEKVMEVAEAEVEIRKTKKGKK